MPVKHITIRQVIYKRYNAKIQSVGPTFFLQQHVLRAGDKGHISHDCQAIVYAVGTVRRWLLHAVINLDARGAIRQV